MTTDLSGDFELDEEQFDWDVFRPDPDEDEIAAEAAALEDEAELDLDDSDLDWEAALRDEPPSEDDGRSVAAFERIVDTVRGALEEPVPEGAAELSSLSEPDGPEWTLTPEPVDDGDLLLDGEFEPELELALEAEFESDTASWDATDTAGAVHAEFAAPWDGEQEEEWAPPSGDESRSTAEWEPVWRSEEPDAPEPAPAAEWRWDADDDLTGSAPGDAGVAEETEVLGTEAALETEATETEAAVETEPADDIEAAVATTPTPPEATPEARPAHARSGKSSDGKKRSKVFTATVVAACLVLVLAAAVLALRPLHRATPAATSPATHSVPPHGSPTQAARLEAATVEVGSATEAARAAIHSMTSFPTPANVATIVDPYISSLQLYEAVLSDATVPPSASSEAATARSEVNRDLVFLDTIHGLPPIQLGAFLGQVGTDTAQFQTTLSSLEQSLGSSAS